MIILTTTYNKLFGIPLEDTLFCQYNNLKNPIIKKIICYLEVDWDFSEDNKLISSSNNIKLKGVKKEFIELLDNNKYYIKLIKKRPTFEEMFNFSNSFSKNELFIITNSDIYFPIWSNLNKLYSIDLSDKFIVLTRYNIMKELTNRAKKMTKGRTYIHNGEEYMTQWINGCSTDSWIYKTPFKFPEGKFDQKLGIFGVDGVANYLLKKFIKVYNPCLDIFSIHKHRFWKPNKYHYIHYEGTRYAKHEWVKKTILDKGNKMDLVQFCEIGDCV